MLFGSWLMGDLSPRARYQVPKNLIRINVGTLYLANGNKGFICRASKHCDAGRMLCRLQTNYLHQRSSPGGIRHLCCFGCDDFLQEYR